MPNVTNPLYYLLSNFKHHVNSQFNQKTAQKDGTPYCLFKLPCNHQIITINSYRYSLESHHISIYSDYIRSNKSDYHYTAEIIDQITGQVHKLRVYVDANDEVTQCSLKNGEIEVPISKTDALFLTQMGMLHSAPVIRELRNVQKLLISEIIGSLTAIMESISHSPQDDLVSLKACVALADEGIEKAKSLSALGEADDQLKLLEALKSNLEWSIADWLKSTNSTPLMEKEPGEIPALEETLCSISMEPIAGDPEEHKEETHELENEHLFQELETCLRNLSALQPGKNPTAQQAIVYETTAREALATLLICQERTGRSKGSHTINAALIESRELCVKQLIAGLVDKVDFRIIEESGLSPYVRYLPDNIPSLLVRLNLPKQLAWVLEKKQFPLDQIQVRYQHAQQSLLEYAYNINSPACFSVLLQHGASSLIVATNKYPLAHNILQKKNGPFYTALTNEVTKSGENISLFFIRLINLLNASYVKDNLNPTEKEAISSAILNYQELKSTIFVNLENLDSLRKCKAIKAEANRIFKNHIKCSNDIIDGYESKQAKFAELTNQIIIKYPGPNSCPNELTSIVTKYGMQVDHYLTPKIEMHHQLLIISGVISTILHADQLSSRGLNVKILGLSHPIAEYHRLQKTLENSMEQMDIMFRNFQAEITDFYAKIELEAQNPQKNPPRQDIREDVGAELLTQGIFAATARASDLVCADASPSSILNLQ